MTTIASSRVIGKLFSDQFFRPMKRDFSAAQAAAVK